jgi:predicted ferric reductase
MKSFRRIAVIFYIIIALLAITDLNFNNLSWKENNSKYLIIISLITLSISLFAKTKKEDEKKNKN